MSSSAPEPLAGTSRRLLILPIEVAGYGSRVAQGFRELDWEVDVLDVSGNPFGYPQLEAGDPTIATLNRAYASARLARPGRARWIRLRARPLALWAAVASVPKYDAVLYLFGQSLMGPLDPWLVRRAGGRVIAVFLGSDSRPAFLNGRYTNTGRPLPVWRTLVRSMLSARRVRMMQRAADEVICHPASGHFFTKPFVNWLAVGMPCPTVDVPRPSESPSPRTVLVHAPSVQRQKGTSEILSAVECLQARGLDVDVILLTGLPNHEVARAIRDSDAVIDELYSDTPLAGLASEAAAQGRAVLTFGYAQRLLADDSVRFGFPMEHYRPPEDLESAVERLIVDRAWRHSLAIALHEYVTDECQPATVARRLERLIEEGAPADWLVDPAGVDYCEGWGAPRATTRRAIRRYVGILGPWALLLPTTGRARGAVLSFARNSRNNDASGSVP